MEEGLERIAVETQKRNADLRAKGLIGNNTLSIRDFTDHPARAAIPARGDLRRRPVPVARRPGQLGADLPQPPKLNTFEPGVTADVHLSSILTSADRWSLPARSRSGRFKT